MHELSQRINTLTERLKEDPENTNLRLAVARLQAQLNDLKGINDGECLMCSG